MTGADDVFDIDVFIAYVMSHGNCILIFGKGSCVMTVRFTRIVSVVPYGDTLSIVETSGGQKVVANRKEDGSFRWEPGEYALFIPEKSVIPEDVLKERGYWDTEKNRGLLDGNKRNRVKARKWGPDKIVASGLLFKLRRDKELLCIDRGDNVSMSSPGRVEALLDTDNLEASHFLDIHL